MCSLNSEELARWLNIPSHFIQGSSIPKITGISTDSRTLEKGDLFVAIEGAQVDGHQYIHEAKAKGAAAALVNRHKSIANQIGLPLIPVENPLLALGEIARCYRQQFKIPMAAVTGSCGKTSVKEMIASILITAGPTLATRGNLNTEVGVPLTLVRLKPTHQAAVIEMGARKQGDIQYLMNIAKPTVSLITNAGVAHLEIFGSERGIAEAKGEIYSNLSDQGSAVINLDDPNASYWQGLLRDQRTLTFGFDPQANVVATDLAQTAMGSVFKIKTPAGEEKIHLSSPGRHSISNALAAVATALAMDISLANIKEGLEAFIPVEGRLHTKLGKKGIRVIDDSYNANPASMKVALEVLAACEGTTIFVMGDMFELGANAEKLHASIGLEAKRLKIQRMLGVGSLTKQAINAFGEGGVHFPDKQSLLSALNEINLSDQATILVKGSRGMRMEEIVNALV